VSDEPPSGNCQFKQEDIVSDQRVIDGVSQGYCRGTDRKFGRIISRLFNTRQGLSADAEQPEHHSAPDYIAEFGV
jgi:hypothetical protein